MDVKQCTGNIPESSDLKYIITMDMAFEFLGKGIICIDEFKSFLEKMTTKYNQENLRILYQTKLDIFLDKSVNTSAKGDD